MGHDAPRLVGDHLLHRPFLLAVGQERQVGKAGRRLRNFRERTRADSSRTYPVIDGIPQLLSPDERQTTPPGFSPRVQLPHGRGEISDASVHPERHRSFPGQDSSQYFRDSRTGTRLAKSCSLAPPEQPSSKCSQFFGRAEIDRIRFIRVNREHSAVRRHCQNFMIFGWRTSDFYVITYSLHGC